MRTAFGKSLPTPKCLCSIRRTRLRTDSGTTSLSVKVLLVESKKLMINLTKIGRGYSASFTLNVMSNVYGAFLF